MEIPNNVALGTIEVQLTTLYNATPDCPVQIRVHPECKPVGLAMITKKGTLEIIVTHPVRHFVHEAPDGEFQIMCFALQRPREPKGVIRLVSVDPSVTLHYW